MILANLKHALLAAAAATTLLPLAFKDSDCNDETWSKSGITYKNGKVPDFHDVPQGFEVTGLDYWDSTVRMWKADRSSRPLKLEYVDKFHSDTNGNCKDWNNAWVAWEVTGPSAPSLPLNTRTERVVVRKID
ncbi:Uu.00g061050.m01.CDS01 [Anthostomella pinea]|uniref:Uu.00g061050.m01.CDS01 n=1 Tax=Anthostomella pinea TaxID=933095 RepID=A0AAI8YMM5_9PEZI|nr:Uu.00g061050.m01.CDS01 [Anthostomella pinea]